MMKIQFMDPQAVFHGSLSTLGTPRASAIASVCSVVMEQPTVVVWPLRREKACLLFAFFVLRKTY